MHLLKSWKKFRILIVDNDVNPMNSRLVPGEGMTFHFDLPAQLPEEI